MGLSVILMEGASAARACVSRSNVGITMYTALIIQVLDMQGSVRLRKCTAVGSFMAPARIINSIISFRELKLLKAVIM